MCHRKCLLGSKGTRDPCLVLLVCLLLVRGVMFNHVPQVWAFLKNP